MSETNSKIESQFNKFFNEVKSPFTNLKVERECSEEEVTKDEEIMEQIDHQMNDHELNKFEDIEKLNEFKNFADLDRLNEISKIANLERLNELSKLNELNNVNKLNESVKSSESLVDRQAHDSNQLNSTVDTSSLGNNLVNKSSHENSIELKGKFKQSEQPMIQNQHLISSLNTFMQSNSQQQNDQFSQKLMELLLSSALGQQTDQQNNQQPNNGDCESNRQHESKQLKQLDEASSFSNSVRSFQMNKDSNRDTNREMNRTRDINNLNKQATLAAALVASMNQFSNNQLPGSQLTNSHLTNSQSASNQLNSNQIANSQITNNQLINNQLRNNQELSNQQLICNQRLHNSLNFENVKNLILNSQRKNETCQLAENSNIFSGGFQNLLTNLNLSINNNDSYHHNSSTNTIASPNWRPIRSNTQNIITSAKQTGPASWIDRSKLGKVAAQNLKRRHVSSRCDYTEYYKGYSSSVECGAKSCVELNYREHYHCLDCQQRTFVKKEELIRHFKWHRKREESFVNGFLRYSSCDDCSPEFPRCASNGKHTHYHCLKKGCDKCYISTSDVQMHSSYHRKDAMMLEEGFQRFRGTEDCECSKCQFSGQKTTHFHCMRSNCNYIFKNKAEMEKHKTSHFKDEQLSKDGFQKFQKNECGITDCPSASNPAHYHCVKTGCNAVFETTGQLYAHRKKHERREVELAYNKILFAQSNCNMFNSLGELAAFDITVFEDTEQYNGFVYTPEIDTLIQQLPLSTVCSMPFENMVKECKGATCLKYFNETIINDHKYYRCMKCDETCKLSSVEDHARNHILIDECTSMMFAQCEDGRNGLYECNLMELGKHYHCKMFNCNFVISVNGSELKRLHHFKKHEDEQKDSFIDDVTHSNSSSINSTTDLNCSNNVGQSNSFIDLNTESTYMTSSPIAQLNNSNLNTSLNNNPNNNGNYGPGKGVQRRVEHEVISDQNSPQFAKDDIEQFTNLINSSNNNQFDSSNSSINNSNSISNQISIANSINSFTNTYSSILNRSSSLQDANKIQLQNSLLDGSNSLLKRKRGRPPKKMDDELVCSSKKNHLSTFFNPLIGQDNLANVNNLEKSNDSNVSMFLNSLLMQNEMMESGKNDNFNNMNNQMSNYTNYQSMGNQQINESFVQNRDSFSNNSPQSASINFQMLNYIANINQASSQQQTQNLINQLINPTLNNALNQQFYKNLFKQHKKSSLNKFSDLKND